MINIICPDRVPDSDIDIIILEKNRGETKDTLIKLKPNILVRYKAYSKIESNRRLKPIKFEEIEKKALQNLYYSKTATAKKLIEEINKVLLEIQSGCCVSCGIGEADEIDHFLPKETFPEFSILHKNLIPICGTCNNIKGENIPGNIFDFFHPMFDKLPIQSFLNCLIEYSDSTPKSHFSVKKEYSKTVIGRHFQSMKLKERLEKKATQYFLQVRAFKNSYGYEFAERELEGDIQRNTIIFGSNFWRTLLSTEMMNSDFLQNI